LSFSTYFAVLILFQVLIIALICFTGGRKKGISTCYLC